MSFTLCSPNRQLSCFVLFLSSVFFLLSLVQSIVSYFPQFQSERSLVVYLLGFHFVFDLVVLCDLESPPTNFQTCHLQYSKIATVVFHFLSLYYFTFLYYSQYFVTLSVKSSVRIVTRYPFCCAICTNIYPRCTDIASELKRQNYKQLLTIRTNKVFYRLKISSIHFLFCEILILSLM